MRASRPRTTRADRPPAGPLHVRRRGRPPGAAAAPRQGGRGRRPHGGRRRVGQPDAARRGAGLRGAAHQRAETRVRVRPRLRSADSGRAARHRGRVRRELRGQGRSTSRACGRRPPADLATRRRGARGHRLRLRDRRRDRGSPVRHAGDPGGRHAGAARPGVAGPPGRAGRARPRARPDARDVPARTWCSRRSRRRSATRRCRCPRPRSRTAPGRSRPSVAARSSTSASARSSTPARATCSRRLLAGLAAVPAEVLVTVGHTVDPAAFGEPARAHHDRAVRRPGRRAAAVWARGLARRLGQPDGRAGRTDCPRC